MAATTTLNPEMTTQLSNFQAQSTNSSTLTSNKSPTSSPSHAQYSNFYDFRLSPQITSNVFDASSSSSSSPTSSSSSDSSTSSLCNNMLDQLNDKNINSFNNELTITNSSNVSIKRILQEIKNNNNTKNVNQNDSLPDTPSSSHRTASFSLFDNENQMINTTNKMPDYNNTNKSFNADMINLENLNNLIGSFVQYGNNNFNNKNSQYFFQNLTHENSKDTQRNQELISRHDNNNSNNIINKNNSSQEMEQKEYYVNMMRKRFNSCSTVDFEFLKTRTSSDSFNYRQDDSSINNITDNLARLNSFNSDIDLKQVSTSASNENTNMPVNNSEIKLLENNFKQFRHNSIIGTNNNYKSTQNSTNISNNNNNNNGQLKDHRALSFSYNSNNNSSIKNMNFNSNQIHKNQNHFGNNNDLSQNQYSLNTVPCLSPNCLMLSSDQHENKFDQNLIRFGCNSCQTIRYMHRICYDKAYLELVNISNNQMNKNYNISKSFDANKFQENQIKVIAVKFSCTNCINGVVLKFQNYSKISSNQQPHQQQNFDSNNTNITWRKKSLCSNNPPLPVPMQPVRESSSRSPSPSFTLSQFQHQNSYNNANHNHNKLAKRPSAPVNVPKNRCRTMSTGSTGSFSASSSFSSSIGNSFLIGSPINHGTNGNTSWKKGSNQQQQQQQQQQTSPYHNNNNQISNNNSILHLSNNNLNQQEANLKSDAECLNNMLATISSKLNLQNTESLEEKLAATGNIFYSRDDWSIFSKVPFAKQNTIMLRLEDEGPYGNDETRCFVLSHFSTLCIREVKCIICDCKLPIYDKFPLLDGTLFVSPIKYDELKNSYANDAAGDKEGIKSSISSSTSSLDQQENSGAHLTVPAVISNKNQFIYAICLNCLHSKNGHEIKCKYCKQAWKGGSSLQIGTMYKYEIFAAFPCCQKKLNCSKCDFQIINLNATGGLQYFSSYSEEKECANCKIKDFHFIKPLNKCYDTVAKKC